MRVSSFMLLLCLALCASYASAQSISIAKLPMYESDIDTINNTETVYMTWRKDLEKVPENSIASWYLSVSAVTDTTSYTISVEQSLDDAGTVWIETFTVDASDNTLTTDTYAFLVPCWGFRQRVKLVGTGTSSKALVKSFTKVVANPSPYTFDGVLIN